MPRKHNNDEMEEIEKIVEEWELNKNSKDKCEFWDNIHKENFKNPSVVKGSKEMEISAEEIKKWYLEHYLGNCVSGDI